MLTQHPDLDGFVVPDDSDGDPVSRKRKRSFQSAPPPPLDRIATEDQDIPEVSTARKWTFDPDAPSSQAEARTPRPRPADTPARNSKSSAKHNVMTKTPEARYSWLANIVDADRNPPGHPDYDPRTIYIPPLAWNNFSPFEKQYWEIKQKFWDTIVFFKKGKFYELYENDALIGEREFDLKRTVRVNMSMVGVPEAVLDHWANQFVAKGYKIARVDQMESALGKEMRERDGAKVAQKDKVIRRELATVLTAGTLVDGGMLQGDQATYCVAIREQDVDGLPTFGIAFVDTATAQFHLVDIQDDADMTKFETFLAQTRPAELVLEKSCLSQKAVRKIKNNISQATIWNWLKPTKEFWPGDITAREVEASGYFVAKEGEEDPWPKALREASEKELVMSAFGGLLQYLRTLLIDRELVSLGNIQWYDPVRRATSLVLDGQSLINLEIFANTFDGGSDGTLFQMLNRCVTPFGKRLLRQWVCHPLADPRRIEERFDAVEALMANASTTDRFTSSLTKLPDLERLISRIHAGRCKSEDFVKVLEGYEQIDFTMDQLCSFGEGEGVLGRLLTSMPKLGELLKPWKTAFDKEMAKKEGILMPTPGVEADFDDSSETIAACEAELNELLVKARKSLGSTAICFRDNGKEIYQLEVPVKIKDIPKSWDQMSATKQVKRYYTPELRRLVRDLLEARENHAAIVKEVASRFYARFDKDYSSWLSAVNVISQLDCLISLSRASASLGSPSCIADADARTTVSFTDLRHPTMLTSVSDFIPNTINLGGFSDEDASLNPSINLLTGANAAGKSTILRMTCVAVLLAQLGCHLPCEAATLTPVDRIMSRLGANDNILQQQSTFFVELAETKKILQEATPRSLVILDELGRGTSSVDGLAVAEAVLHHIAGHVGCTGFFATHYHSLAHEFANHPEVAPKRMAIAVDEEEKRVTFLYKLEDGVAEGSFGMHCAAMCGIQRSIIENAERAAEEWEHSGRMLKEATRKKMGKDDEGRGEITLGWLSDIVWMLRDDGAEADMDGAINDRALDVLARAVAAM
jgi:DNA mismatch repair protein MSH6